jgi:hypothetical protein
MNQTKHRIGSSDIHPPMLLPVTAQQAALAQAARFSRKLRVSRAPRSFFAQVVWKTSHPLRKKFPIISSTKALCREKVTPMNKKLNRKGSSAPMLIAGFILLGMIVIGSVGYIAVKTKIISFGAGTLNSVGGTSTQTVDMSDGAASCIGINNVAVTYDDLNKYTPGTDPGVGNLYITTDRIGSVAEGSNTLNAQKSYEAVAGQNATAYFAQVVSFKTGCSDSRLPVDVTIATAPTITITNDNGVTLNADTSGEEAASASSSYEPTLTVKSAASVCASKHGAILVADYDKSWVQKVEFPTLTAANAPGYLGHAVMENSTADGFNAALFSGELCNGAKTEVPVKVTMTSGTIVNGNGNVMFHWVPLNYDVDQDTFKIIGPAAEDEDNNALTLANTTLQYYVS